ncbi:MAG: thiamine diphosphokinase [Bacilli bacterium]|nr:thiamine diphosphokinase [Bacilli bacterium]
MIIKLVCAGGGGFQELYEHDEGEFLVGIDGGSLSIIKAGLKLDYAIGDFDSVNLALIAPYAALVKIYPSKKNYSDLELAIREFADLKPKKIIIYNGTGGRLDHFLAAINLIIKYDYLDIELLDGSNSIKLLLNDSIIKKTKYKYLSLFALEAGTVISLQGLKYNLDNYHLSCLDNLCISNEISTEAKICTNKKLLLVQTL